MAKPPEAGNKSPDKCPVDHETRAAWLTANPSTTTFPMPNTSAAASVQDTSRASHGSLSTSSEQIETSSPPPTPKGWFSRFFSSSSTRESQQTQPVSQHLSTEREVSTIPRASAVTSDPAERAANNEIEGGVSKSGNWIYPSEKMFFDAMARKGFQTEAENMRTIVPIHNAVNERAWKEIKEWERPWGAEEKCGGPRLDSFMGISTSMSPKARINTLLGYTAPFDRHDWVVDRCGTKIEYVIDFYAGKDDGKGKLNFYLDVRPKLNSLEGWKMRAARTFGFV